MWESTDTTANNTIGYNSQISFYEYPSQKPFINSIYQPLRSSHAISSTVALPESNRDQLLTALQSLTLRIKTLENEREKAELNLRQITGDIHRPRTRHKNSADIPEKQTKKFDQVLEPRQDQYNNAIDITHEDRSRKSRKKKQSSQETHSYESTNTDGRHFHLDMNTVPFILGASTAPSHNVKSNVQNVIALLKTHNHQLCLSSKEYSELLHTNPKSDLSPHTILYLDHYNKSSRTRSSSASPIRSISTSRPQTSTISNKQCHSRIKHLRQEFAQLAREHTRLNTSRSNSRELEILSRRMEIILNELERLHRQLKFSLRRSSSRESTKTETPLETLRKTRLLQIILKNPTHSRERTHRIRPKSND